MAAIARLGLAVTATFVVVWAPFLANPSDALHVLHRIMPLKRGLYEDYVANFWCTTSMLVKWRSIFSQQVRGRFMHLAFSTHHETSECAVSYSRFLYDSWAAIKMSSCAQALVWLCMGSTLLAAMPVLVQEVRRPTARGLLVCMASSAFAFYLFSYQVMPECPQLLCTHVRKHQHISMGEAACPFFPYGTYAWPQSMHLSALDWSERFCPCNNPGCFLETLWTGL